MCYTGVYINSDTYIPSRYTNSETNYRCNKPKGKRRMALNF